MPQPRVSDPSPDALRMRAARARKRGEVTPQDVADIAAQTNVQQERQRAAKSNGRPARASAPPAPPRFSGPLNNTAEVLDAVRLAARGEVSLDTPTAKLLLDHLSRPGSGADAVEQRMLDLASTCPHCGGKL